MKYGAVKWSRAAAERGHGDPVSQSPADPERRFHYPCPVRINQ